MPSHLGVHLGVLAGVAATALFVLSALPMLTKAARTKDLASYSGTNLLIANLGNAAQTAYIATLPPGPVWVLHGFNTLASALMLTWWIRAACASNKAQTAAARIPSPWLATAAE